jgi:FtsH-binding integral membrane protein
MFGANYNDNDVINYRSAEEINSAMGRVYGHMSMAVLVSMLVSYWIGTTPELLQFFFTGVLKWIVIFAPLAAIFGVSMVLANNPSKSVV